MMSTDNADDSRSPQNEKETKTKTAATTTTTSLGERDDGRARRGWTTSVRDVDKDDFVC